MPRASFRSSTVSYFFLFVQMPSTLGTRGFFSRLRRSCLRPSADETKLPNVREKKPLVPRLDATFFIGKCTFIFWRHLLILQINIQIELTNQSFTIIYAKHGFIFFFQNLLYLKIIIVTWDKNDCFFTL